eukprot:CAMPEP_0114497978 /NCGR_PEP_ID=MMETSP0109-20121206/6623_1 /TAXON_ID=29199 /ORGANISM="Chlorarachnion reptans, Strain CCCM449" /LENGTH=560 /DNA_ID=CAMNT_0001675417 /DNA_START=198 /DNA_END=1880 /DNA_ORIENTATION=+
MKIGTPTRSSRTTSKSGLSPRKSVPSVSSISSSLGGRNGNLVQMTISAGVLTMLVISIIIVALYMLVTATMLGEEGTSEAELEKMRCRGIADPETEMLDLRGCNLEELPVTVFGYKNLKVLDASDNSLAQLPIEFVGAASHHLKQLEIVFLSKNKFKQIPDLSSLPALRILGMRNNALHGIPVTNLPVNSMEWLILTGNHIREIPKEIMKLKKLRKLMLSHNEIKTIPKEISSLSNLQMLRIANNRLTLIPNDQLLRLPNLAWVAAAGNPFAETITDRKMATKPEIPISEVTLKERVGSGSGGRIHRSVYKGTVVGVKLWNENGEFSDGTAESEVRAHAVLRHNSIAGAIGILKRPSLGLILYWFENAVSLGNPPTFKTVVQDTVPSTAASLSAYRPENILDTCITLVEALTYMHSKGFAHGDFYLHNTLEVDIPNKEKKRRVVLSDFGAAWEYHSDSTSVWIRRTEVVALGHLLLDVAEFAVAREDCAKDLNVVQWIAELGTLCIRAKGGTSRVSNMSQWDESHGTVDRRASNLFNSKDVDSFERILLALQRLKSGRIL